jgi:flagellum-specific ATP synthase
VEASIDLSKYRSFIANTRLVKKSGKVTRIVGMILEGDGPPCSVGATCSIFPLSGKDPVKAQVVGFQDNKVLLMPLGDIFGIEPGSKIEAEEDSPSFSVSPNLIGRIIDGAGEPIDGKGHIPLGVQYPLMGKHINPLKRNRINEPLNMGVRAINGLLTCAKGQRIGIMAGTGVGKSVLMGMIARNTSADLNVIALIGERGREVREFIDENLGPEGLKKSIVIVATSDQPPPVRLRGAYIATTIAEYFRDEGKNVVLMMDSVTRFAMAQREIGLSAGEPPTTRGYTPSVFSLLPRLLERAGTSEASGSITGLYTVLVEGDDLSEPVADSIRAILDGHIILSRDLAAHNHYPAIDVLSSVSRLMIDVASKDHYAATMKFKDILATYKEAEDLINIGAYAKGSNPKIDKAIEKIDAMNNFLRQGIMETTGLEESVEGLKQIIG